MEDEDFLRRPPAPKPYVLPSGQLVAPRAAIDGTIALLRRAGSRESGCIWYGRRGAGGAGTVTMVIAPLQRMAPFNYHIPADALTTVVRGLPDDVRPLAQVHSHPGVNVEHSRYDDKMVMSKRVLSLVFPTYGRYVVATFPRGVGVHEWQEDYWHLLPENLSARRIRVGGGEVEITDMRR